MKFRSFKMPRSMVVGLFVLVLILLLLWASPILNYISVEQKQIEDLDARSVRSVFEEDLETQEGSTRDRETQTPRVVVSMTTIPSRIHRTSTVLKSLIRQKRQADEIALNLPWKTLKGDEYTLPEWMEQMVQLGHIKIYRIDEDLGPATKLLPTLRREHPDTKILVVDDDYVYAPNHIERLVRASDMYPDAAITAFTKNLIHSKKPDKPPTGGQAWIFFRSQQQRISDLVLGCFGFLVKPRFFTEGLFDYSEAPDAALWVDDIWFSGHLWMNGVEIRSPPFDTRAIALPVIKQLRSEGLIRSKNKGGQNDNVTIRYFWEKGLWQRPGNPGLTRST